MKNDEVILSTLGHTWILDLDGTIIKHNGYKIDGKDTFLPGAKEFLLNIPDKDMIIFITSRKEECREMTESFLKKHLIRYNYILFGVPNGERILINDEKPSGLRMSLAINCIRDQFCLEKFAEDNSL